MSVDCVRNVCGQSGMYLACLWDCRDMPVVCVGYVQHFVHVFGQIHDTWREQSDEPECEELEGVSLRTCKLDYAYKACAEDYEGEEIEWCRTHVRNRV